ncbi:hypothetical protein NNG48_07095 [Enterococcus faecium]|nr:hypothetical protein [Enterococcus faecium]
MLLTILGWLIIAWCILGTVGFITGMIAIVLRITDFCCDWLEKRNL